MSEENQGQNNESIGLDPLMKKSYKELLKDIPKRVIALISKLIGYKTFILGGCGFLATKGVLSEWAFVAIVIIVLFEREGLKMIERMRG